MMTTKQRTEIDELLTFCRKTIKIRTGLDVVVSVQVTAGDTQEMVSQLAVMVFEGLGMTEAHLVQQSRRWHICAARQVAALLIRKHCPTASLKMIATALHCICHTSAIHQLKTGEHRLLMDEARFVDTYKRANTYIDNNINRLKDGRKLHAEDEPRKAGVAVEFIQFGDKPGGTGGGRAAGSAC
jgi:hypothetical protein